MYPILFKFGPLTIYTYGVFVFLGVISGLYVVLKEARRDNLPQEVFLNIAFWGIIFSFLGARALYIILNWGNFLKDPWRMIFSRSGFVFYGGFISGSLTVYLLTRKNKISFFKFSDIASLGIALGHSLGRLGCFFNGCCFGKPTSSFLGILFPPYSLAGLQGQKVIPTQLISFFFLMMLFIYLRKLKRKKKFDGQVFIHYLFMYGVFRFIIEFFRADKRGEIFSLPPSQFISLLVIISALGLTLRLKRRRG